MEQQEHRILQELRRQLELRHQLELRRQLELRLHLELRPQASDPTASSLDLEMSHLAVDPLIPWALSCQLVLWPPLEAIFLRVNLFLVVNWLFWEMVSVLHPDQVAMEEDMVETRDSTSLWIPRWALSWEP